MTLVDSLINLIEFTCKLISFLLPLSVSIRSPLHRHTQLQCMTQCTLMPLIVSAGVNSPPHHAGESVLSRMAEYLGPLLSPPLLRYPKYGLFLSLRLSAKCHWRLALCTKQRRAVSDGCSAEDLHLNNASPFFISPDYVMLNCVSRKGAIIRQWMCDDEFSNLLSLFSLIESHYNDEMLFL